MFVKKVFEEKPRVKMIVGNCLEDSWCDAVKAELDKKGSPVLFIAEGVFMYLTLEEIGKFLKILKDNFSRGRLITEQNNPMMVKKQKYHDTVKATKAEFKSGTWSGQEIEDLCQGFRFIEEMRKYSFGGRLFAALLPKMNDRWASFDW